MQINVDIGSHKIMTMEPVKRERVLSAAMEEFAKGFKAASTDAIVSKAGISKGLLFHYFGTKRDLYHYLCDYALETAVKEFAPVLDEKQEDMLERIWQMALLKRELCSRYPNIFEFLTAVYYQMQEEPGKVFAVRFGQLQSEIYDLFYREADENLLKEGIDRIMAANVIRWTLNGLSEQITRDKKPFQEMNREFDRYLEETRQYLDMLRSMLYRKG